MSRNAICEWCGRVFRGKYGTEKFCSKQCRAEDKELSAAARIRRGKGGTTSRETSSDVQFMDA